MASPLNLTPQQLKKMGLCANRPLNEIGLLSPQFADPAILADIGVPWLRLNFVKLGDQWLDMYDRIADQYLAKGIRLYGTIGHEAMQGIVDITKMFRSHDGTGAKNPLPGEPNDGAQREAVARYVEVFEQVVNRLGSKIQVFESFNEPNEWQGGSSPIVEPQWFAVMVDEIYRRVHPAHPGVRIVSGPVSGTWRSSNSAREYFRTMFKFGFDHLGWTRDTLPFDGVGYHLYICEAQIDDEFPCNKESNFEDCYKTFLDQIWAVVTDFAGQNTKLRLWLSEFGWRSGISEDFQANMIRRAIPLFARDDRVALATYYSAEDHPDFDYGLHRLGDFGESGRKKSYHTFKEIFAGVLGAPDMPGAMNFMRTGSEALRFRVIVAGLKVRQDHSMAAAPSDIVLRHGDVVEVDPTSAVDQDGLVWWQHELGWSAECTSDRQTLFMKRVEG